MKNTKIISSCLQGLLCGRGGIRGFISGQMAHGGLESIYRCLFRYAINRMPVMIRARESPV